MRVSFIFRHVILVALLLWPQYFWLGRAWRFVARASRPWLKWTGQTFLILATVATVLVVFNNTAYRILPDWLSYIVAPPVQLWIFTSILALICMLAVHLAGWAWSGVVQLSSAFRHASDGDQGRRTFVRRAAYLVGALPFFPALYGFARERMHFKIVRVDVPVSDLPAALQGLRIVQISDIHCGLYMPPDEIRRAVGMANSLAADLAVVTGDFISRKGDPLEACIAEISRLSAPLGVWGCNGNHEIYANAEKKAESLFARHGMTLLRRSSAQLSWNGQSFNLIGVDYQPEWVAGARPSSLPGVDSLVRGDMPNILLSHNPNTFYRAAHLGIDLTLSGHTHGGQINLEILDPSLNPARFMTRFVAGLYHLPQPANQERPARTAWLYVNRGLGTLGVPARIGAEPEITLLTLHSA